MNKYEICDYENALECVSLNGYSKKANNIFYYAPDCYRQDMYEDFEETPELTGVSAFLYFQENFP